MKLWAVYALLAITANHALGIDKLTGVQPQLISKYAPSKGEKRQWTCLDGSKTIPWSAVNNDYCDCPGDGSDEPGTSACPNSTFYCKNEGHIGTTIRSSRVNDGLCEPECCDGSDEAPGVCPNRCEEIGKAYRNQKEVEAKIRKTGSKIRSSYIAFANKEKKRLEDLVATSARNVVAKEKEVARLKEILDRTESTSAAELEKKRESPLYQSLVAHSAALKALKRSRDELAAKEKALSDILSTLRGGYNPNYQDMAVLEAVRGYEYYAGLPPSNDRDRAKEEEADAAADEILESESPEAIEQLEDGEWTTEQLQQGLDNLLEEDFDSLLLEHDQFVGAETTGSVLFDLSSYIPDALLPQYEALKDSFVDLLEMLGIAKGTEEESSGATSKAHQAFQDAEKDLRASQREKESAQEDLAKLFDPEYYGNEGEWKKLDKECLSKESGDYIYEVCLFGEARQKPLKGGSTFSLGKFSSWNKKEGIAPGSPEFFSRMHYTNGQKCYNGPMRSVTVEFKCGTENAILSVAEPEKCEYQFSGTSPALCQPLDGDGKGEKKKDEL